LISRLEYVKLLSGTVEGFRFTIQGSPGNFGRDLRADN
jgi:hypothetical protein